MHVQSLVNRKAAELSPATVRHLHVCLSKAMNQAVDWDLLPKNPAHRVKLPYNPRVRRQTLSRENVAAFFEAAKGDRFEALYVLAGTLAMRPGELLALRWPDVDVANDTIWVRATLTDGEDGPEIRDETKTGRDRILEAPRSAMAALRTHRKYQNEERLKYAGLWRDLGLIFPSAKGTSMRRQNLQRRSYKPLLKAAGLLDIRLYDLRHTCLTLMRKSGEDLKTAQEVAGHSSIKTTSDTYTHTDSRQMREAADRFEEYLWGRFEGT